MKRKACKQAKLKLRKGDLVRVMAGNSKGLQGEILEVLVPKNRALVAHTNIVVKHIKPSASNPKGGIIKKEAPIHISNLMLIDPKTGLPTRVGKAKNDKGKLVRIAKKSGEEIK